MPTLLALAAVQITMLGYVIYTQRKMEKIMATVQPGLAALQTNMAALTTAVTKIIAIVQSADPDATIASIASQVQAEVDALNAAINPPAPPAS